MSKNNLITIYCFGEEIGLLGFDTDRLVSSFQYNPAYLESGKYLQLFPLIFKRIKQTQVFRNYNNETFRGLPPMIADSLPDLFGNIIFKAWMESTQKNVSQLSVLEQLAYVGTRGMGALEYQPSKIISSNDTVNIDEIAEIARQVLEHKTMLTGSKLDHASLLTIFKIGTSAGGIRPKILVSQNKEDGTIIPGDVVLTDEYEYYLVKLGLEEARYSREVIEYAYYLTATKTGIQMMESKMIEGRHFATRRFDRINSRKKHILTATGMTGWDYKDPAVSSYENLFDLLNFLKCPHRDTEQLFRRLVFNIVFANHDDHLKNHSFIYDEHTDRWELAPAYDLTYSLNPELNIKTHSRALSINGKREGICMDDLKILADKYTIKSIGGIISDIENAIDYWINCIKELGIPNHVIDTMRKNFTTIGI